MRAEGAAESDDRTVLWSLTAESTEETIILWSKLLLWILQFWTNTRSPKWISKHGNRTINAGDIILKHTLKLQTKDPFPPCQSHVIHYDGLFISPMGLRAECGLQACLTAKYVHKWFLFHILYLLSIVSPEIWMIIGILNTTLNGRKRPSRSEDMHYSEPWNWLCEATRCPRAGPCYNEGRTYAYGHVEIDSSTSEFCFCQCEGLLYSLASRPRVVLN